MTITDRTYQDADLTRVASLARGLVQLAALKDIQAALTLVEQLRLVLEGMSKPDDTFNPTIWERLTQEDES